LKKPITKRAGGMAQGVGPEFKPQYQEKKKKGKKGYLIKKELLPASSSTMFHFSFTAQEGEKKGRIREKERQGGQKRYHSQHQEWG
jgi:hypothetical protein